MKFWWDNINPNHAVDELDILKLSYIDCLKDRTIFINGKIDEDSFEKYYLPLLAMENSKDNSSITILLNSYGGEIVPAFALIDLIDSLKKSTVIYIVGEVISSGFYLSMAGHNNPNVHTYCTKYTRGMIHSPFLPYEENDNDSIKSLLEFQKRYDKEVIYEYIKSHSKITQDMLDKWEGTEHYFTARELEEFGIAKVC